MPPVDLELALKAKRLDAGRQPNVHDERVMAVHRRPSARTPGWTTASLAPPPVRDAAERADEVDDVVAQCLGAGRVLDAAGAAVLGHRSAVAVEEPLKHGDPTSTALWR